MRDIYARHRGPFVLCITRRSSGQTGRSTEWTEAPLKAPDADEKARMLVGDPRDDVEAVHVYSVTEQQFIGAAYGRTAQAAPWDKTTTTDTAADAAEGENDMAKKSSAAVATAAAKAPKAAKVTKGAVKDAVKAAAAKGARASFPYFATRKGLPENVGGQKRVVHAAVLAAGDAGLQKAALLEVVSKDALFKGKDADTVSNNVSFYLSKLTGEGYLRRGRETEPVGDAAAQ